MLARNVVSVALAASIGLSSFAFGMDIQGTYFNKSGKSTDFSNHGGTIRVPGGSTLRGIESTNGEMSGATGNGGHIVLNANIVRIDGTVDVSAIKNGGVYLGNGGRLDVNAQYMFHNGNIYANGNNGGIVSINVGSMMMGPNSRIEANGVNGYAGQVIINSSGEFTMEKGSVISANGTPMEQLDFSNIKVVASIVNVNGIMTANGLISEGGTIKLVANVQDVNIGPDAVVTANGGPSSDGGHIMMSAENGLVNIDSSAALQVNGGDGVSGGTPTQGGEAGTITVTQATFGDLPNNTKVLFDNAWSDDVDFNNIQVGETVTFKIDGSTVTKGNQTLTYGDVFVEATRVDSDNVHLIFKDSNNNTLLMQDKNGNIFTNGKTYDLADKHETHGGFVFNATLEDQDGNISNVNVVRDFNYTNANKNAPSNFTALPTGDIVAVKTGTSTTVTNGSAGQDGQFVPVDKPPIDNPPSDPPTDPPVDPPIEEPPNNPPVGNPPSEEPANNLTPKEIDSEGPNSNSSSNSDINNGLYGLFQQYVEEGGDDEGTVVIIGLEKSEMFFKPQYAEVANEIFTLAYDTYDQQLANGVPQDQAFQAMTDILQIAGVNNMVALAYSGKGFSPLVAANPEFKPLADDGSKKNKLLLQAFDEISNVITPLGVDEDKVRKQKFQNLKIKKKYYIPRVRNTMSPGSSRF